MRIIIKNPPKNSDASTFSSVFSRFGKVTDIYFPQTKNVVFIGYETADMANTAVKFGNKIYVRNRRLQVELACTKISTATQRIPGLILDPQFVVANFESTINAKSFILNGYQDISRIKKIFSSIKSIYTTQTSSIIHLKSSINLPRSLIICGKYVSISKLSSKVFKLFFDLPTITAAACSQRKVDKRDLLADDEDLGVRVNVVENSVIEQTKEFLMKEGINLEAVTGKINRKCLVIRNMTNTDEIDFASKISESPNKTIKLMYFDNEKDAKKAYKILHMRREKDRVVYVEYLPETISKSCLDKSLTCSEEEISRIPVNGEEKNIETKKSCISQNPTEINANKKIVIKNVPFQATVKEIRKLIGPVAKIVKIRLPVKRDGQHRGFCFVTFQNVEDSKLVIERLKDTHLYGRKLVLLFSDN